MGDAELMMRTTLDIADHVLAAARAIAREQGKTTVEVVSELARASLKKRVRIRSRDGVPLLKVRNRGVRVTLERVNALRDETLPVFP
jgi:hypothetical protein